MTDNQPTQDAASTGPEHKTPDSLVETQHGGTHYKDMAIQPAEYCHRNGFQFCESEAIKYLSRFRSKNGAEDLKKAIHFAQMILDMEYGVQSNVTYGGEPTAKTEPEVPLVSEAQADPNDFVPREKVVLACGKDAVVFGTHFAFEALQDLREVNGIKPGSEVFSLMAVAMKREFPTVATEMLNRKLGTDYPVEFFNSRTMGGSSSPSWEPVRNMPLLDRNSLPIKTTGGHDPVSGHLHHLHVKPGSLTITIGTHNMRSVESGDLYRIFTTEKKSEQANGRVDWVGGKVTFKLPVAPAPGLEILCDYEYDRSKYGE